jgi:hypothetical protein
LRFHADLRQTVSGQYTDYGGRNPCVVAAWTGFSA